MKKIKWKNVFIAMLFLISGVVITHDLFMLTIYSTVTSYTTTLSVFGCLTLGSSIYVFSNCYEYFNGLMEM
jgi:hypothetical protein